MSTNYIPADDAPIAFLDLLGDCDETIQIRPFKEGSSLEASLAEPAPTAFDPKTQYFVTDGVNTLHLNFNPDGTLESADRYGANDVENLLNFLGDMVSEHDDEYWDLMNARDPDNSEAAIEAAVDGVVAGLLRHN